jgi:hypothetical protein
MYLFVELMATTPKERTCRKAGPDITSKTEFVNGNEKFKRESLAY